MKVVDATRPLVFRITAKHIAAAKCKDPQQCVTAQALRDALGDHLEQFEVGGRITKVWTTDKIVRYETPAALRLALIEFDKTGRWNLPLGTYQVRKPAKGRRLGESGGRTRTGPHKTKRAKKRHAVPTRHTTIARG